MTSDHDHQPGRADMRAALVLTVAILDGDDEAARAAAGGGACPQCTAMAASSYGITAASQMAGDKTFVSEAVRQTLRAMAAATLRELDAAPN
jgi:hypothetical protein